MTDTDKPFAGRLALVTGASRGIGRATALALAGAGAHVIATARTQGALEELDDEIRRTTGEGATLVPLDLKTGRDIDQLGGAIFDRWKKLDMLVAAAGEPGISTPVAHLDPGVWERTLSVNLTASYRLIRSMDPLLRASDAGRAVFFTCGLRGAFWGPVAAAKAGLEALVDAWREESAVSGLRAALVDPGPVAGRFRSTNFPGEDAGALTPPEAVAPLVLDLLRPDREPPAGVVRYAA